MHLTDRLFVLPKQVRYQAALLPGPLPGVVTLTANLTAKPVDDGPGHNSLSSQALWTLVDAGARDRDGNAMIHRRSAVFPGSWEVPCRCQDLTSSRTHD
jgi:hypothetical protein